ncbi:hypothetical protein GGI19_005581 [Coemansia pectinata]|uniref:RING-type domain-containing protein n=1 Tax=Coemansia pectinata TaxID=1052879 RepID=A0A9W8GU08_9FUNG|nr:hypothetical protein GGI19_005581 [Coemansia pectinata]
MPTLFRRSQAARGHAHQRQRPTWEERARAALAAAREVEESSGESVPTRPSEVNASRRLCYGPRYVLPGTQGDTDEPKVHQREELCTVLQANMALDIASLHMASLMMDTTDSPDAVVQSPFYTLAFTVNTLVPVTVNLFWLAVEEWDTPDSSHSCPYPRFVSRVNLCRTYTLEPGLCQQFALPRADWLDPKCEPYRTLVSSDWQARNGSVPLAGTPAVALPLPQTPAISESTEVGIEMEVLRPRHSGEHKDLPSSSRLAGATSEIQELSASAQKTPAYGLVIELVERRPGKSAMGKGDNRHQTNSQISYIEFYKEGPSHVTPRCIRQKLCIEGALFLQYEIFGLSETLQSRSGPSTDELLQCAICLSDERDTAMLPCRHLCMCRECASTYRQQSNKCPICRTVVDMILHVNTSSECI